MKIKYVIGTIIIVVFIIWAGISFNKTLTPYVSLADAKKTQSIVQVKGKRINDGTFDMVKNLFISKHSLSRCCSGIIRNGLR